MQEPPTPTESGRSPPELHSIEEAGDLSADAFWGTHISQGALDSGVARANDGGAGGGQRGASDHNPTFFSHQGQGPVLEHAASGPKIAATVGCSAMIPQPGDSDMACNAKACVEAGCKSWRSHSALAQTQGREANTKPAQPSTRNEAQTSAP